MKTKIVSSDIYFVAALVATGAARIDRESVDRSDPRHIRFTVIQDPTAPVYSFKSTNLPDGGTVGTQSAGLEHFETLWDSGTMFVNAIAYKNAIQQVKSLVHAT